MTKNAAVRQMFDMPLEVWYCLQLAQGRRLCVALPSCPCRWRAVAAASPPPASNDTWQSCPGNWRNQGRVRL